MADSRYPSQVGGTGCTLLLALEEGSGTEVADGAGRCGDGDIVGDVEWADGRGGNNSALKFGGKVQAQYVLIPIDEDQGCRVEEEFTIEFVFRVDKLPADGDVYTIFNRYAEANSCIC